MVAAQKKKKMKSAKWPQLWGSGDLALEQLHRVWNYDFSKVPLNPEELDPILHSPVIHLFEGLESGVDWANRVVPVEKGPVRYLPSRESMGEWVRQLATFRNYLLACFVHIIFCDPQEIHSENGMPLGAVGMKLIITPKSNPTKKDRERWDFYRAEGLRNLRRKIEESGFKTELTFGPGWSLVPSCGAPGTLEQKIYRLYFQSLAQDDSVKTPPFFASRYCYRCRNFYRGHGNRKNCIKCGLGAQRTQASRERRARTEWMARLRSIRDAIRECRAKRPLDCVDMNPVRQLRDDLGRRWEWEKSLEPLLQSLINGDPPESAWEKMPHRMKFADLRRGARDKKGGGNYVAH